jgi:hypothetical protein
MSIETMTKLSSTTVGAGGSASITFSNIPQGYTDLAIKISSRTNRAADEDGLGLQINNLTSGYTYRVFAADGASITSVTTAYNQTWVGRIQGATAGSGIFSTTDVYIPDYSTFTPKSYYCESVTEKNATNGYMTFTGILQASSEPVTSITLSGLNATLQQHTTVVLYGVKNARQTAGNSIKATGGNIVFDGTYVYHVFTSTETFVPTSSFRADYLVVAGGGSGANSVGYSECAGGGGAGGYRTTVGTSGGGGSAETPVYLNASTPYAVTIGAGGAGKSTYGGGNQGNASAFFTINSRAGGAAGADGGGSAGGSGGGAGTSGGIDRVAGLGTAGQGYDGGNSKAVASPSNNNAGGGGGGAGGVGVAGASGVAGNGGPGLTAFDGNVYAGGGGGNTFGSGGVQGSGGSGIGGNGVSTSTSGNGGNGKINTGSGGGACGASGSVSGAGGSGIVIIRYKG